MKGWTVYFWALLGLFINPVISAEEEYYGKVIGKFTSYAHNISGRVYAVNENTIFIKGFTYDGRGPDAFFWTGRTDRPTPNGNIIPYPKYYKGPEPPILGEFRNEDVILYLPEGMKIRDMTYLSIWCRRFTVNFGDVFIPENLEPPRPRVLPEFKRLAHGLKSGNITILDAKTIYIPNLHYDGAGPDAYFWIGTGHEPAPDGHRVPNEEGSLDPLKGYEGQDIRIILPDGFTVHNIDYLAMWCVQYRHNFGHVYIPDNLDVPPYLGRKSEEDNNGISQQNSCWEKASNIPNCRPFLNKERIQVRWRIDGTDVEFAIFSKMKDDQYVAFGPSGAQGRSLMLGAHVVVAFYNKRNGTFDAADYHLSAEAQCDGKTGVCPVERSGYDRNQVKVECGERRGSTTLLLLRRPMWTKKITNPMAVTVIAAIGNLNARNEANYHYNQRTPKEDNNQINFQSNNNIECETNPDDSDTNEVELTPWPQAVIENESEFHAKIGPTGGNRGYIKLTGQPSWGICWYINDALIPELYVERGKTYTFVVEGGSNPTNPAKYHPFYITDSREGGFGQKTELEQRKQRVYAGIGYDSLGYPYPTAAGRYCEWEHRTVDKSAETNTFSEYMKTLHLQCEDGAPPSVFNWTVELDTPDLLYYQCYTHNNLGWKIHISDPGQRPRRDGLSAGQSTKNTLSFILIVFTCILLSRTR